MTQKQEGGDDVITYVPVSVSLDQYTSESVDLSVSVSSYRSADPGLVRVDDIPRRAFVGRSKCLDEKT